MLEMELIGEHRRLLTKSEQPGGPYLSAAVVVGEYVCASNDGHRELMTERQAKKAYGARRVCKALKRKNRKTSLKRHDKHPQHV